MMRMLEIHREQLEPPDTRGLENIAAEADRNPELARQLQGTISLVFPDQETEDNLVWTEPLVRAWFKRAYARVPHLLYYLAPEAGLGAIHFLVGAYADPGKVSVVDGQAQVQFDEPVIDALADHLAAAASFADRMADDGRKIANDFASQLDPRLTEYLMHTVEAKMSEGRPA